MYIVHDVQLQSTLSGRVEDTHHTSSHPAQPNEVTGSQAASGAASSPAQPQLSYSAVVSCSAAAPKLPAMPNQVCGTM